MYNGFSNHAIVIILLIYYVDTNSSTSYIHTNERSTLESKNCYNESTQVELMTNIAYPIPYEQLFNTTFTILDNRLIIIYPFACVEYTLFPVFIQNEDPISSIFIYGLNGSTHFDTYVPVDCDQPCVPLMDGNNITSPIYKTWSQLEQSVPVLIPLGMDEMINVQSWNNKLQTFSNIKLANGSMEYYYVMFNNTETYTDDILYQTNYGYFFLDGYYFNFQFCPYPYCYDSIGIYPPGYMEIYSLSTVLPIGCEYILPFTWVPCGMKREAICESNCPDSFSVSVFNNLLTIKNSGIVVFQNQTNLGNFNWTISNVSPVAPTTSEDQKLAEGISWAGFALGLLLYLAGAVAISCYLYERCCRRITNL